VAALVAVGTVVLVKVGAGVGLGMVVGVAVGRGEGVIVGEGSHEAPDNLPTQEESQAVVTASAKSSTRNKLLFSLKLVLPLDQRVVPGGRSGGPAQG
jgi:hypothetical protein